MSDDSGSAEASVSGQLHKFIVSSGLTAYSLGKVAGVDAGMIQRFLNGERGLRLATVDRLAAALGLRLVNLQACAKVLPLPDVNIGHCQARSSQG